MHRNLKVHFKKLKFSWRRCRRSAKSKRDAGAFAKGKEIQSLLKGLMAEEKISLYYFDESGFSTASSVPYAWQAKGRTLETPCFHSKRLNVPGFMSMDNRAFFHAHEGRVGTVQVVAAFDAFAWAYADEYAVHKKPCIVVLDNASTHTSAASGRPAACSCITCRPTAPN